jgi:hypothetical protein
LLLSAAKMYCFRASFHAANVCHLLVAPFLATIASAAILELAAILGLAATIGCTIVAVGNSFLPMCSRLVSSLVALPKNLLSVLALVPLLLLPLLQLALLRLSSS